MILTILAKLAECHFPDVYSGKLLKQPDSGLERNAWGELYVLLFDNYSECPLLESFAGLVTYSRSGYDKAEGEGRYHQISCSSTGTRLYIFTVHDCLIPFQPSL